MIIIVQRIRGSHCIWCVVTMFKEQNNFIRLRRIEMKIMNKIETKIVFIIAKVLSLFVLYSIIETKSTKDPNAKIRKKLWRLQIPRR